MKKYLDNQFKSLQSLHPKVGELLKNQQTFHHPFGKSAKDHFAHQKYITLFTYGSLLNRDSALRTIGHSTYESRIPAITFGYKRIFNRDVDVSNSDRYTTPINKKERGMLNLTSTGKFDDVVNGFTFQLPLEEIGAMCERERGYDLVPCIAYPWCNGAAIDADETQLSNCYTFLASNHEGTRESAQVIRDDITPIKEYFDLVKSGASQYGKDFLWLWYETTILADGKTPVAQWEKSYNQVSGK